MSIDRCRTWQVLREKNWVGQQYVRIVERKKTILSQLLVRPENTVKQTIHWQLLKQFRNSSGFRKFHTFEESGKISK